MARKLPSLNRFGKPLVAFTSEAKGVLANKKFTSFLFLLFAWSVADAAVSTISPVMIENTVSDALLMGIIFGFSSFVGTLCDFFYSKFFADKKSAFFIKWFLVSTVSTLLLFMVVPPSVPMLLVVMALWGVYYELQSFSNFSVIKESAAIKDHPTAWGILQTVSAIGYTIATPLMAYLFALHSTMAFGVAMVVLFIASLFSRRLLRSKTAASHVPTQPEPVARPNLSVLTTIHIWLSLQKKVWPIFVFFFTIYLANVSFWTIGILFADELSQTSTAGFFLLVTFNLPYIFVTISPPLIASRFSKKRSALVCGALAGIFLVFVSMSTNSWMLVGFMLAATTCLALAIPLVQSVFENYVARLGKFQLPMVGIQASAVSLAYTIGPIFNGFVADKLGYQHTFGVIGLIVASVSLVFLLIVHGKFRMPQQELLALLSNGNQSVSK